MTNKLPTTRAEIIQFLKDLEQGKRSVSDLHQPDLSKLTLDELRQLKQIIIEVKANTLVYSWEDLAAHRNNQDFIKGIQRALETRPSNYYEL